MKYLVLLGESKIGCLCSDFFFVFSKALISINLFLYIFTRTFLVLSSDNFAFEIGLYLDGAFNKLAINALS